jgi:uncharacterized protein YndB with AHSA1/START domain
MDKTQSPANLTLQTKRTFRAPRERVFRAWTDRAELAQWFAPSEEYSAVVPELELRVGGRYRVEMHHKGGIVHTLSGTYQEIKPPEKWFSPGDGTAMPARKTRWLPSNFVIWEIPRK